MCAARSKTAQGLPARQRHTNPAGVRLGGLSPAAHGSCYKGIFILSHSLWEPGVDISIEACALMLEGPRRAAVC